jgi:flagellar hook-basal body complex protein FliE
MNAISSIRPFVPPEMRPANPVGGIPQAPPSASSVEELQKLAGPATAQAVPGSGPVRETFGNLLNRFVHEVNGKQAAAGENVNALLSGENIPLHQAMIAMEEASVSFQLMVEVRNKLLESYQEIMRMQV